LAVLYTYNETNDGNVPLTGVSVTDDSCAPVVLVSGDVANPGVLDPGESWVFTCTVVLTTAGTYTNTAIASGTTLNGRVVTYNQTSQTGDADEIANATVTVTSEECTILTKTADKTIVEPGDTITYTITEFNCGTAPIGSVVVTDSYKGDLGAPSSGDAVNPGVLDPGETWTWTYTRTVTAEDSCPINNNVTATGVNLVKDEDATPENATATVNCIVIGGEILGVDAAALLIAGAGANVFTILPILGAIAGAAFFAARRWT
jgi:hypothetical protein